MTRIAPKSMQAAEGVEGQVLYVAEERRLVPEMKFRLAVWGTRNILLARRAYFW